MRSGLPRSNAIALIAFDSILIQGVLENTLQIGKMRLYFRQPSFSAFVPFLNISRGLRIVLESLNPWMQEYWKTRKLYEYIKCYLEIEKSVLEYKRLSTIERYNVGKLSELTKNKK